MDDDALAANLFFPAQSCLTWASTATRVPYVRPAKQHEDHSLHVIRRHVLSIVPWSESWLASISWTDG
ncbi:uncharacterized protein LACBIDRAFT_306997 [Laccaria bicolor S238N-H82]|uniref:Predicted protein n=1 Tax=Laccaria bicolor (strain S238N-H82 / ATCC MYA-4686) TaxID=486041 RepID=B0DP50_LACBS|nr:uncharacterized protein LACBIDRAFT_306997 [Laccaria bicolor S238N-H82]EDR03623.1 predicted protein [Laccaria bicolor S238N-H82]|eukprot:XP_001885771.1 predicted protein [Laccaria bicolor S238N-H82]